MQQCSRGLTKLDHGYWPPVELRWDIAMSIDKIMQICFRLTNHGTLTVSKFATRVGKIAYRSRQNRMRIPASYLRFLLLAAIVVWPPTIEQLIV